MQAFREVDRKFAKKLISAVKNGDVNDVRALLASKKEMCFTDDEGRTIFHHLFASRHFNCVNVEAKLREILNAIKRYDKSTVEGLVNITDKEDGKTAIYYAIQNYGRLEEDVDGQDLKIFQLLVDAGAKVTISDNNGITPIHLSALRSSFCVFKLLFEKAVKEKSFSTEAVVGISDTQGNTPLYYAVSNDLPRFSTPEHCRVKGWFDRYNYHYSDDNCESSIELHKKISFLIGKNAEVNNSIILEAIKSRKAFGVIKLLLDPKLSSTLNFDFTERISFAAREKDRNLFKFLVCAMVEAKIGINTVIEDGKTVLHLFFDIKNEYYDSYELSSLNGDDFGFLKFLLDADDAEADINAVDNNGKTPLEMAIDYGIGKIIEIFLEKRDIDISAKCSNGQTLLETAVSLGATQVVEVFFKSGNADINAICSDGHTLFSKTISSYGTGAADFLASKGALVFTPNADGTTPLHLAALHNNLEAAKLIIKFGGTMSINSVSRRNETPIDVAVGKNSPEMVNFLCENGANVSLSLVPWSIICGSFKATGALVKNEAVLRKATKLALTAVGIILLAASSQQALATTAALLDKALQNLPLSNSVFTAGLGVGILVAIATNFCALGLGRTQEVSRRL